MKSLVFALLGMTVMCGASAQIYKSVGADGKVVYSDRPSDSRGASVSIIKAAVVTKIEIAPAPAVSIRTEICPNEAQLTDGQGKTGPKAGFLSI